MSASVYTHSAPLGEIWSINIKTKITKKCGLQMLYTDTDQWTPVLFTIHCTVHCPLHCTVHFYTLYFTLYSTLYTLSSTVYCKPLQPPFPPSTKGPALWVGGGSRGLETNCPTPLFCFLPAHPSIIFPHVSPLFWLPQYPPLCHSEGTRWSKYIFFFKSHSSGTNSQLSRYVGMCFCQSDFPLAVRGEPKCNLLSIG